MPKTQVILFQDSDGSVPYKTWLDNEVIKRDIRAAAKCNSLLTMLEDKGRYIRRPQGDYLRDGIYELRTKFGGVNYRLLYFFYGDVIAVVSHGLTKLDVVPDKDIDAAIERKKLFESDPERYSYGG